MEPDLLHDTAPAQLQPQLPPCGDCSSSGFCQDDSGGASEEECCSSGSGSLSGSAGQSVFKKAKEDVPPAAMSSSVQCLRLTDQLKELQTVIRDRDTSRSDFIFYADRLIRLVVEEALNHLPYAKVNVVTPTGCTYEGVRYIKGVICGVSIMRSGEAMEQGLRDCCRSIRIGKILIQTDSDTNEAKVIYAKFPADVQSRTVLLMYPIMNSGNTVVKAVQVLREHGVDIDSVVLLTLFCTPSGLQAVTNAYPTLKILTSEVHPVTPNHFGQRYFGTD